jgi:hypothetical protein
MAVAKNVSPSEGAVQAAVEAGDIVRYQHDFDQWCPGIVRRVHEDGSIDLTVFLGPDDWPTPYGAGVRADSLLGAHAENRPQGEELGHWKPK